MAVSRSATRTAAGRGGGNPGKAGPKGALGLPTARKSKAGRDVDKNEQRNFVTLSKAERKRSHRDGSN